MNISYAAVLDALPNAARTPAKNLLIEAAIAVKITAKRKSKHGDFRITPQGTSLITINASSNSYRFLLTLIHELAHWYTYKTFGHRVKPHGREWKQTFQQLMLPFLIPEIFPEPLLMPLARHLKNPKASAAADIELVKAFRYFDPPKDTVAVADIEEGKQFKLEDGRVFVRGEKRVKRYLCLEVNTERRYLFSAVAEVYRHD
jgi:SprT protein